MALCNITGTVYLPNGQLARSRTITFRRRTKEIGAEYLGVVLPDDVVTQTNAQGRIDVDVLTGSYTVFAGQFYATANVPDSPAADFADIVAAGALPPAPPVWYQQALAARDEAVAAAESIHDMEVATGPAGSQATWDGTTLTVPRGDEGPRGDAGPQGPAGGPGPQGDVGPAGQSVVITTVTTQAAYDAATPGPLEIVIRTA